MASEERLRELEEKYEGFTVYDNGGSKIGKVDDLFVDETDNEEYIGVKMGFFGSKSTLIPTEIVRINERDRTIEVSDSKDHVKDAPSFSDDDDVTTEYEERIRGHFGLESLGSGSQRGSYGGTASGAASGATSGSSEQDSSYATGGNDTESSDRDTRESTYDASTGVATAGGAGSTGQQGSGESTSSGEYSEQSGSGGTGTQHENTATSGSTGSSTTEGSSGSKPTTTRQTEETETFQEGGRTKIRRRIIREEVVDADDQSANS